MTTKRELEELVIAFDAVVHEKFPNPERKGCPGHPLLEELAMHPENFRSPATLAHLTRCAPCLDELKELHVGAKKRPAKQQSTM